MHTYTNIHTTDIRQQERQQQHTIQTGVAFVCVLRLLWSLAVAEPLSESWRRRAAATGATLPLILTSHAILSTTRPPISCLLAHASVAREAAQCSDAARRSDQFRLFFWR